MSDPEPEEDNRGAEETLPRGINEPGSAEPEADTLEQQLPPESGEDTGQGDSYPEETGPRRVTGVSVGRSRRRRDRAAARRRA